MSITNTESDVLISVEQHIARLSCSYGILGAYVIVGKNYTADRQSYIIDKENLNIVYTSIGKFLESVGAIDKEINT